MELKKERNTKNYTMKKHHQKDDKKDYFNKLQKKEQATNFDSMSAETLLEFLENKFQKLEKEGVINHNMKYVIAKRIKFIVCSFHLGLQTDLAQFMNRADPKRSVESLIQQMRTKNSLNFYPVKARNLHSYRIKLVCLSSNLNNAQKYQQGLYILDHFNEEEFEIDMKRMFSQSKKTLTDFIEYKKDVRKLLLTNYY